MSETAGTIGYGLTVLVETAPGAGQADNETGWFELAEVFDFTPPDPQTDQVDRTHYKSPNRTREFTSGLTDNGSLTLSMNYIPGSDTDVFILDWKASGENRKVRNIYESGVQQTVPAFPLSYKRAIPLDDKMTADLELKAAGSELQEAAA